MYEIVVYKYPMVDVDSEVIVDEDHTNSHVLRPRFYWVIYR